MKDILIQYGVEVIVAIVVALLGIFGAWLAKVTAKKIELSNIASAKDEVISAAQQTVLDLKQTIVDDLKKAAKDGKLTPEEIADLGVKLLSVTIAKLSVPTIKLLEAAKIDISALIKSAGEAYIGDLKRW